MIGNTWLTRLLQLFANREKKQKWKNEKSNFRDSAGRIFLFNSHFAHSSVCWQTFAIEVALKLRSENDVNLRIFEHIASSFLRIFSFSGIFQRDLNIFLLPEPHDLVLEPKRKQFNITLRYVYNLLSRRGEAGKT